MTYNRLNNVVGWAVFAFATIVYLLTVAPTASFWDCGEFIAVANELEVSHPPGAPMYLLLGRVFAMFAAGNPANVAYMVNLLSVFASSFTVLFIFWTITALAKRALAANEKDPSGDSRVLILGAGLVGALACTFTDSFWFNAVEAEVYSLSSLFTAVVFWLMLKWDARADEPGHLRWILLITYVMGLSIGVHLLNLLTIPALGVMYYLRKYPFSWRGVAVAFGISVVILGVMNTFVIKTTFDLALAFEKTLVGADTVSYDAATNTFKTLSGTGMGLPMGYGALVFFIVLFAALAFGIYWTQKKRKVVANTVLLGTAMLYLGMSSYAVIFIRANANTPINENDPSDIVYFVKYMKREQYGDWPILYGHMYNSEYTWKETDEPNYVRVAGYPKYILDGKKYKQEFTTNNRFFPRMHSQQGHYSSMGGDFAYSKYVSDKGADPNNPFDDKVSGMENIKFFLEYQVAHMYVRYFLWNFVGRESDEQDANWESGFASLLGADKDLPEEMKADKSRNHYFYLPLLLGLLGAVWHFGARKRDASIVALLFFFTGLAIILYLNQTPSQPRERDYSYAGSFQTFCIWIGLGVVAVADLLQRVIKNKTAYISTFLCIALVPSVMGVQNWADHSRRGVYLPTDSAYNLLNSCAPNAILFTNGDNDTFPLWYLQEVEGIRTDVRIVNLSLLNTDWYINQLKFPINNSPALPITIPDFEYVDEKNNVFPWPKAKKLSLPVDKEALLKNKVMLAKDTARAVSRFEWSVPGIQVGQGQYGLQKKDKIIVNLIENIAKAGWDRPIYFAVSIPEDSYLGLTEYFRLEGYAYRVTPIRTINPQPQPGYYGFVDLEITYENMIKKFQYRGLNDPGVFLDAQQSKRMILNMRNNFIRLAEAYATEAMMLESKALQNIADKAKDDPAAAMQDPEDAQKVEFYRQRAAEVLDFCKKTLSEEQVPNPPYLNISYAQVYDNIGAKDKAKADALKTYDQIMQYVKFKAANPTRNIDNYDYYIYRVLPVCHMLVRDNGDAQKATEIANTYKEITGDDQLIKQLNQQSIPQMPGQAGAGDTAQK